MTKITFLGGPGEAAISIDVERGTSILVAAKRAGAEVGYACGGVCACSTCHVYVKEGLSSLSAQQEKEEDILDKAFDVRSTSRLSCQSKVGDVPIVVEISAESRRAWLDEHPEARAARAK
jgi:2Fe-2S ferredoxin